MIATIAVCALVASVWLQPSKDEATVSRLRGHIVLGHEVRSFEPCGEDATLWVVPTAELLAAYEELTHEPYASLFVELRGRREPAPEDGFGRDYEAQLRVLELMRAAPASESKGCEEDLTDAVFLASGNEPFWHARVSRRAMTFSSLDGTELTLAPPRPQRTEEGWHYGAKTFSLSLREGFCADTMVGTRYRWRARVEVDGKLFEGCAWEGELAPMPHLSTLSGPTWRLVSIESADGRTKEPSLSAVPTITFTEDENDDGRRRFYGHGGCNRYFGGYVAGEDGSFSVPGPIGATRMACPDPMMGIEMALFRALEGARSYEIDGDTLTIHGETGTLRFALADEEK